jgi:hypothetical protein
MVIHTPHLIGLYAIVVATHKALKALCGDEVTQVVVVGAMCNIEEWGDITTAMYLIDDGV